MAALSSNWKKLQAKLKEESASKPSLKRKSETPATNPLPKKSKIQKSLTKTQKSPKAAQTVAKKPMGGVHSSKIEETVPGTSTSLALWAEDHDVSAEALAEAYNLGAKDSSMMLASAKDKVNHGLTEGIEIGKYIAIDCEMVGVGPGGYESALARVSVVDFHGVQIYDSYVKPKEKVTNWRTAVSGISQKSMRFARDFEEVQADIDKLLRGRILIGHDLKHDLEALILSHPGKDIRDTAKFPGFKKYGNGSPVIAMTLTLGAVYAPIAMMGGITGSLFKEFALTLAGSVFVSGIVALTLSPMMCSKMLKAHAEPSKFEQKVHGVLDGMTNRYERMLGAVMQHRPVFIGFAIIVFASLPMLFKFIPSELAPSEDKGVIMLMGTAPSNANLDFMQNTMNDVNTILSDQPEVAYAQVFTGVPNANQAFGIASMVPWSEREASQSEVANRVGGLVKDVPGMAVTAFQMPELPGAGSGLPIQFVITTPNSFESLFQITTDILADVSSNPLFVYSDLDLNYDSATMKINIDKDKAGAYGVTMQDIGITLGTMMSDGYVNRIDLNGRSYEVIPQVERKFRLNPESMNNYYVRAADGNAVPLGSLITIDVVAEPRSLPHFNQLNSATIGAVPAPGAAMGDAIAWFEDTAANKLPSGYNHDYMGEARQYVTEGSALYATFGLALAIIFLVLAIQFESLKDPLVIMVSVPLAICGALIALAWGAATMNIYSQVGLITLVGLITKHGILICEVAKEEQLHHHKTRIEAVMEAAKVRLRPILMTTAAMIAGLIPLMYASGAGAAQRFSIGIVIVAGLAIGTLFTLFVLPVIYSYLAEKHKPLPVFVEDKDLEKLARVDEAKAAQRGFADNK